MSCDRCRANPEYASRQNRSAAGACAFVGSPLSRITPHQNALACGASVSGVGFISEDPMGLAAGLNEYAYVNGSPNNGNDPRGLESPMFQCQPYGPLDCTPPSLPTCNFSLGAGGWGNFLGAYAGAESGVDMDTRGTLCFHTQTCHGLIAGLPLQGELGLTGGMGTGDLCSCTEESRGGFLIGGAGVMGGGQFTSSGSGHSFSKGIFGVGGSPEGPAAGGGGMKCQTTYWCTK